MVFTLLLQHSMQRRTKTTIISWMRCCLKALRAIKMATQERKIYSFLRRVSLLLGTIITLIATWTVMSIATGECKEWNTSGWISCRVVRILWIIRRVAKRHSGMRRVVALRGVFRIIVVVSHMLVLFVHCRRRLDSFKGNWMNRGCVWMIWKLIYRQHRNSIHWRCLAKRRNQWNRLLR